MPSPVFPCGVKKTNKLVGDRDRNSFVSHPLGFIHMQPGELQPAVLTDVHTGEVLVTYEEGIHFGLPRLNARFATMNNLLNAINYSVKMILLFRESKANGFDRFGIYFSSGL